MASASLVVRRARTTGAGGEAVSVLDLRANTVVPNSLEAYIRQIGRIPLLTAVDEVLLAQRMEAGLGAARRLADENGDLSAEQRCDLCRTVRDGQRAREQMIRANLRLVVSVARRYVGRGLDVLDLIQEGNAGLIHAVEKFDYAKGLKFSTYAVWWIRQTITRALGDQARTIRIPFYVMELVNKLRRLQRELIGELGHEPSDAELATAADLPTARLVELRGYLRDPISLDRVIGREGEAVLADHIADADGHTPPELAELANLRQRIGSVLASLTEREADVICLRFGLTDDSPRTLAEIGRMYGVSREQVRLIQGRALTKLKQPPARQQLEEFAE